MFDTKKDVDKHVRTSLGKLRTESEVRFFSISFFILLIFKPFDRINFIHYLPKNAFITIIIVIRENFGLV